MIHFRRATRHTAIIDVYFASNVLLRRAPASIFALFLLCRKDKALIRSNVSVLKIR
jgi:hypothetical protein